MRKLGIPTVVDRMIQQALLHVLEPLWEPTFSEHSYGFRPNRSAQQAVTQAMGSATATLPVGPIEVRYWQEYGKQHPMGAHTN